MKRLLALLLLLTAGPALAQGSPAGWRELPLVAYETANTIAGQARLSEPGSLETIYDSAWIGRATEAALNLGK